MILEDEEYFEDQNLMVYNLNDKRLKKYFQDSSTKIENNITMKNAGYSLFLLIIIRVIFYIWKT